jgi:hypothetical protein
MPDQGVWNSGRQASRVLLTNRRHRSNMPQAEVSPGFISQHTFPSDERPFQLCPIFPLRAWNAFNLVEWQLEHFPHRKDTAGSRSLLDTLHPWKHNVGDR